MSAAMVLFIAISAPLTSTMLSTPFTVNCNGEKRQKYHVIVSTGNVYGEVFNVSYVQNHLYRTSFRWVLLLVRGFHSTFCECTSLVRYLECLITNFKSILPMFVCRARPD